MCFSLISEFQKKLLSWGSTQIKWKPFSWPHWGASLRHGCQYVPLVKLFLIFDYSHFRETGHSVKNSHSEREDLIPFLIQKLILKRRSCSGEAGVFPNSRGLRGGDGQTPDRVPSLALRARGLWLSPLTAQKAACLWGHLLKMLSCFLRAEEGLSTLGSGSVSQ